MVDLINKFLGNQSGEGLKQTSLNTFRRFICDFNSLLKKTKRESWVLFTSDPESEIFM